MASNIDPTVPADGIHPDKQDFRDNFSAAKDEIEALQGNEPAGDTVGTTDAQTLTNKTLVVANNTVTTAAAGNLAATELNAALAELDGQDTTNANNLAAHEADVANPHAVTKTQVGLANVINTLQLVAADIGSTVQAWDADLDTLAGLADVTPLTDLAAGNTVAPELVVESVATTVNNSTTLVDATNLAVALAANETVFFDVVVRFSSNTTADVKFAFTVPADATLRWSPVNRSTGSNGSGQSQGDEIDISGETKEFSGSATAGVQMLALTGFVDNGATPGNLQLQFAQNTADAQNTSVFGNSRIIAWRV